MTTKRKTTTRKPKSPRTVLVRWVNVHIGFSGQWQTDGMVYTSNDYAKCCAVCPKKYRQVRIEIPVEGVMEVSIPMSLKQQRVRRLRHES